MLISPTAPSLTAEVNTNTLIVQTTDNYSSTPADNPHYCFQTAVGRPPKVLPQPVVVGR